MNKLIALAVLSCLALQCEKQQASPEPEPLSACGTSNPTKDLGWLKDIITKADADKATQAYKGNYTGKVYLESLRKEPVFLVEMMMGSGGLAGYLYRCNGDRVYPTDQEITTTIANFQKKNVVYSNVLY